MIRAEHVGLLGEIVASLGVGVRRHLVLSDEDKAIVSRYWHLALCPKRPARAYARTRYPGFSYGVWMERDVGSGDAVFFVNTAPLMADSELDQSRSDGDWDPEFARLVIPIGAEREIVPWDDDEAAPPGYPTGGRAAVMRALRSSTERKSVAASHRATMAAQLRFHSRMSRNEAGKQEQARSVEHAAWKRAASLKEGA